MNHEEKLLGQTYVSALFIKCIINKGENKKCERLLSRNNDYITQVFLFYPYYSPAADGLQKALTANRITPIDKRKSKISVTARI